MTRTLDLLIPWLVLYVFIIIGSIGAAIIIGLFMEKYEYKLFAIIPSVASVYYCYLWICVYALYKEGLEKKALILTKFAHIALGIILKPRGQLRGRGIIQMTIL